MNTCAYTHTHTHLNLDQIEVTLKSPKLHQYVKELSRSNSLTHIPDQKVSSFLMMVHMHGQ